jgi:hypothetical protein
MGLFCRLGLLVLLLLSQADFFASGRLVVGFGFFALLAAFGFWLLLVLPAALWWFTYGVGLSLYCYRSISFAPVRGGTYFLCRRKESRQRKRAHTANS